MVINWTSLHGSDNKIKMITETKFPKTQKLIKSFLKSSNINLKNMAQSVWHSVGE